MYLLGLQYEAPSDPSPPLSCLLQIPPWGLGQIQTPISMDVLEKIE